jgi:hypothetical protein
LGFAHCREFFVFVDTGEDEIQEKNNERLGEICDIAGGDEGLTVFSFGSEYSGTVFTERIRYSEEVDERSNVFVRG